MDRKHTKTIIIIMAAIIFALLVAVGILLVNAAKIPVPAACQNDGEANWPVIGAEVGRIGDELAIYTYSAWYSLTPNN